LAVETGGSGAGAWAIVAKSEGVGLGCEKGVTVTPGTSLKAIVRAAAVRQANAALWVGE
jgi:hypothetical protein